MDSTLFQVVLLRRQAMQEGPKLDLTPTLESLQLMPVVVQVDSSEDVRVSVSLEAPQQLLLVSIGVHFPTCPEYSRVHVSRRVASVDGPVSSWHRMSLAALVDGLASFLPRLVALVDGLVSSSPQRPGPPSMILLTLPVSSEFLVALADDLVSS